MDIQKIFKLYSCENGAEKAIQFTIKQIEELTEIDEVWINFLDNKLHRGELAKDTTAELKQKYPIYFKIIKKLLDVVNCLYYKPPLGTRHDEYIDINYFLYDNYDSFLNSIIGPYIKKFHEKDFDLLRNKKITYEHDYELYAIKVTEICTRIVETPKRKIEDILSFLKDVKNIYNRYTEIFTDKTQIFTDTTKYRIITIHDHADILFNFAMPIIELFIITKFHGLKPYDISNTTIHAYAYYSLFLTQRSGVDFEKCYKFRVFLEENFRDGIFYARFCYIFNGFLFYITNPSKNYPQYEIESLQKGLADIYVHNPNFIKNVLNKYSYIPDEFKEIYNGYKNYIDRDCKNIFLKTELDNKKVTDGYCFTNYEFNINRGINPYTQECMKGKCDKYEFAKNEGEMVTLSTDAYNKLLYWTSEIYVFGEIFVKFEEPIAREFAKTLFPKKYKLYRGMQFDNEAEYNKHFNKNSDEYILNTETYTAWTHEEDCARLFVTMQSEEKMVPDEKKYKLIYSAEFDTDDLLIDITKVTNYLGAQDELEVIVKPLKNKKIQTQHTIEDKVQVLYEDQKDRCNLNAIRYNLPKHDESKIPDKEIFIDENGKMGMFMHIFYSNEKNKLSDESKEIAKIQKEAFDKDQRRVEETWRREMQWQKEQQRLEDQRQKEEQYMIETQRQKEEAQKLEEDFQKTKQRIKEEHTQQLEAQREKEEQRRIKKQQQRLEKQQLEEQLQKEEQQRIEQQRQKEEQQSAEQQRQKEEELQRRSIKNEKRISNIQERLQKKEQQRIDEQRKTQELIDQWKNNKEEEIQRRIEKTKKIQQKNEQRRIEEQERLQKEEEKIHKQELELLKKKEEMQEKEQRKQIEAQLLKEKQILEETKLKLEKEKLREIQKQKEEAKLQEQMRKEEEKLQEQTRKEEEKLQKEMQKLEEERKEKLQKEMQKLEEEKRKEMQKEQERLQKLEEEKRKQMQKEREVELQRQKNTNFAINNKIEPVKINDPRSSSSSAAASNDTYKTPTESRISLSTQVKKMEINVPKEIANHNFALLDRFPDQIMLDANYIFPNAGIYSDRYITPLHYSILHNDAALLQKLLSRGVSKTKKIKTAAINEALLDLIPLKFAEMHRANKSIIDILSSNYTPSPEPYQSFF